MEIYIPSKGRAEQLHHTWEALPPSIQNRATIVISPKDAPAYQSRFPIERLMTTDAKGIGAVRQHLIDIADNAVLMLDDDLSFFVRRKDNPKLLQKAQPGDVVQMIKAAERELKNYAHLSIAVREGANRNTDDVIFNIRGLRALGYQAAVLRAEGVRFDRLPVMEDFDVELQLLRLGYDQITLNKWCQDQGASNAPGGCSTYRSMAVQAQGAEGLAKLHPDFVTVVEKDAKSGDAWAKRKDVRVQWKKARESGNARS